MTNKNLFYSVLILFTTVISYAQNTNDSNELPEKQFIKIGIKAGYSLGKLSNTTDNIYTDDYESVSGLDFGVTFEFEITPLISMQTEINYTQRGGKRTGLQPVTANDLSDQLNMFFPFIGLPAVTNQNPLYATFDSESDLQYIEVPALVKFGWGKDFRVSAAVGPYVGILLKATQHTTGESQFYLDSNGETPVFIPGPNGLPPYTNLPAQSLNANTDIKDDLKTVNFGGIFALGISKNINDKNEVFMDARASYSFNSIQIKDEFGESKIGGVIFSLGYAYTIQ
jgi:hypothetical protein